MDNQTIQTFFDVGLALIGALGGWVLSNVRESIRQLHEQDQDLATKVQAIEVLVAGEYCKRDDMDKTIDKLTSAIFTKLDRIENKLDGKVDK